MRLGGNTGGEIVARRLAAAGLDLLVSVPGSQTLPIADAARGAGLRLVVPRHERHGAYLAEGYGQARGVPAVLMDTLGPGVANELVALESARASATPMLCVAPFQPPRKRARVAEVFQGLDHPAFFAGVAKQQFVIDDDAELERDLERALEACLAAPRGPVRVDVAFPLLFRRKLLRAGAPPARTRLAPADRPRFVLVDASGSSVLAATDADRLAPGLPVPGAHASFALGAKLAWPDVPIAVVVGADGLRAGLDALAVATLHDVPVLLVASDAARALADRAAALLGGSVVAAPGDGAALRRLVEDHARELVIVVD